MWKLPHRCAAAPSGVMNRSPPSLSVGSVGSVGEAGSVGEVGEVGGEPTAKDGKAPGPCEPRRLLKPVEGSESRP